MTTLKNAKKFIKTYKLTKNNLTASNLEAIIKRQGYQIVEFNKDYNDLDTEKLLDRLNLDKYKDTKKCFIFKGGMYKYLFIHKSLSDSEKEELYLHELGHIMQNHFNYNDSDVKMESEANEFAFYVKSICGIKQCVVPIMYMIVGIAICATVFYTHSATDVNTVLPISTPTINTPTTTATPTILPTTNLDKVDMTVSVTRTGKRYHLLTCSEITSHTGTRELTVQQAIEQGYTPCKKCRPDEH